ncbi:MAG: beta-N-acetylhexosaminidase [Terriglobia bacterium]|jgi:hexosaminidase
MQTNLHKTLFFLFAISLLITVSGVGADGNTAPAIIPRPVHMEVERGTFPLAPRTKIFVLSDDSGARWVGEYLAKLVSGALGSPVPAHINPNAVRDHGAIFLVLQAPHTLGPEGYELTVTPYNVRIEAEKATGLFYGVQTLRQMLPPEIESHAAVKKRIEIPCLQIQDQPRFSWRGLMLDCSRTFLPISYLRSTIDRMALYKLNMLHLHLTDDQGWRLEIKKYPELTTVGAHYAARYGGDGGFYTQQEMRDLIAYASERNITIVPEIEMPGHSTEVLATYPELACDLPEPRKFEVHPFWGDIVELTQPLCAGNDKLYAMYQDILGEVMDLFPSPFIHVGGDEVPKDAWKRCSRCQARIKAEGLKDEEELQSYFMRRMEKIIEAKGRRLIGWDEILEGGLAPGALVMSWRGTTGGVAAAQMGHDVVMTPNPYTYFDYTYHTTPLEKVYSYDPAATEFTPALAQHILGVQASMWTHIAVTEEAIDYQLYPRLLALAEVAWTPQPLRDWSNFSSRADTHYSRLESLNVKYCDVAAPGEKLGAWQASDLTGETLRQFTWEATAFLPSSSQVQVQVRRDDGEKRTYVRAVALLEDGKEISQVAFPGPLNKYNDVNIGWLQVGQRQAGARYTVRVTLQGSKDGAVSGSLWIMEPLAKHDRVHPR